MQQLAQVKERPFPVKMGEVNYSQSEDVRLETTRARCIEPFTFFKLCLVIIIIQMFQNQNVFFSVSNVLKKHGELTDRLSRDSDKMVFERLQREFEAVRASQTQEICLDVEQWNDGLLATIRERVHMEADRKAMQLSGDGAAMPNLLVQEKITYKVGNKIICCLEGARIGIQYGTSFAGEPCEMFHCVLESKSFLEKMTVLEHTVPFFLPIREAENDFLSFNAMKFIDHVGDLLQAYVDRREQVRLIKELYGNQIGELYFSLPYHMTEFVLTDFDCKVTVSLRYADLVSTIPSAVSVLAWPMQQHKKSTGAAPINRKENGSQGTQSIPTRLQYAEDALRSMSLPEGCNYICDSELFITVIILFIGFLPDIIRSRTKKYMNCKPLVSTNVTLYFSICRDCVEHARSSQMSISEEEICLEPKLTGTEIANFGGIKS